MSADQKVVIMGGGISGHTAAMLLRKYLPRKHEVIVVTPNSRWNWIPSNIWVGVGAMKPDDVTFDLAPVYKNLGVTYIQAKALSIHPDDGYITAEWTGTQKQGLTEQIHYDYLVNATGPKLNFGATEGLDPSLGNSHSVCTAGHAESANEHLQEQIRRMKAGETSNIVVGTGHGTCTCQGAAFEYIFNIDYLLRKEGVRDKARMLWISNEYELGDFGVGGMHIRRGGYITSSKVFAESYYTEKGLHWETRSHVQQVEKDRIHFEQLDGSQKTVKSDFTMLLPPFSGVGIKAYDSAKKDITDTLFAPNGMMKVDADYTKKPFEEWKASDWPETYQSPFYKNIFAIGIAFAPPHAISKPMVSETGTAINPTPPRTGMPSAIMGRIVAKSISDQIKKGPEAKLHSSSMARMGAACVASAGTGGFRGQAASITMYPVVPDYEKYPESGRSLSFTTGEVGWAGHWIKSLLHTMFMYKAKGRPGWWVIPE